MMGRALTCLLQRVLLSWHLVVVKRELEVQTAEVARLKRMLGKKSDSI